jgi:hypothetical protein
MSARVVHCAQGLEHRLQPVSAGKILYFPQENHSSKREKKRKGKSHFMGLSLLAPKEDQGVEETVQKISFSFCFTLCLSFLLYETWYGMVW